MNVIAARLRVSLLPALVHLGLSAGVALLSMGLIFLLWYPAPLDEAQGVSRLVLILIGVDVVLGPLMTCIVYNPAKPRLWLDLAIIAVLQISALGYGLSTIHQGRPIYLVFNIDRFDVVTMKSVVPDSLTRVPGGLEPRLLGARLVAARLPADSGKRNEMMFSAASGGADLPQFPEYYVPLEQDRAQLLKRLHPVEELRRLNDIDAENWQRLLGDFGVASTDLAYLPLAADSKDAAVVVHAKTGEILGIRMFTPNFEAPASSPP